jgi:GPN-loop GTPase
MDISNAIPRTSPVVILVVGMAGSGKTTLMHRINIALQDKGSRGYYINLDPAVGKVPFSANIDIRDTVNYKEVMSQYNLGPVGTHFIVDFVVIRVYFAAHRMAAF